jgi:DmsE family decaheme c-type cytochrome
MRTSVHVVWRVASLVRLSHTIAIGVLCLGLISCAYAPKPRGGIENYPGWYMASQAQGRSFAEPHAPVKKVTHTPRQGPLPVLKVSLPKVPDAEFVNEDELCMTCHQNHTKTFLDKNVHRQLHCEECHGPASEHIGTRGQEVGKILNVKRLGPAERSEFCLRCHEDKAKNQLVPPHAAQWRTSVHAHKGVSCSDCHRAHHDVPKGVPAVTLPQESSRPPQDKLAGNSATRKADPLVRPAAAATTATQAPKPSAAATAAAAAKAKVKPSLRGTSRSLEAATPEVCYRCHEGSHRLNELVGPHKIGPQTGFKCTTCHDAQGTLTLQSGKELCLSCHTGPHAANWLSSTHNEAGLMCTDCHRPHAQISAQALENLKQGITNGIPRPMVVPPIQACLRCHEEMKQVVEIADPHQVGGKNIARCTTCHDPHGKIRESTRKELCMTCHRGTPTTAFNSSIHNLQGITCTDCHDPHPNSHVQRELDIRHTNIRRPQRRPMAVNEPDTCYKCHPQMVAMNQMPSHHPIFEGKMVCSDCHDPHGQALRLLKEPTVNLVCYRCHMEKQGPFVYEHAPVTEDCTICHEPHGTVQNNLLRQPTTFLCLRCHSGHRTGPQNHDSMLLPDIGTNPQLQKAFFSDCTQCHSQIHGSDVPSPSQGHMFMR